MYHQNSNNVNLVSSQALNTDDKEFLLPGYLLGTNRKQ